MGSVATNALLITSRTTLLSKIIADSDGDESYKLWFFSILSVFLGIIVSIEKWVIPDVPEEVTKAVARQTLVENMLIKQQKNDDDDEDGVAGPPDKDVEDWPF